MGPNKKSIWNTFKTLLSFIGKMIFGGEASEIDKQTAPLHKDAKKAKTEGYIEGLNGKKDIQHILSAFQTKCDRVLGSVLRIIKNTRKRIEAELSQIENLLDLTDEERVQREHDKLLPRIQKLFTEKYTIYIAANRLKHTLNKQLRRVQAWIQEHSGPSKKGMFDTVFPTLVLAILIISLEIGFFTPILEAFGFVFGVALLGALGFSMILLFFAETMAHYYRTSRKGFLISCFFGFSFLALIVGLRIIAEDAHWYFTAPAITLLFITSVLVAIRRSKYKEWFNMLIIEASLIHQINQQDNIIHTAQADGKIILDEGKQMAKENAKLEKDRLFNRHIDLQAELDVNHQEETSTKEGFKNFSKEKTDEIIKSHQQGMDDHFGGNGVQGSSPTPIWKNPFLSLLLPITLSLLTACSTGTQPDNFYIHSMIDASTSFNKAQVIPSKLHSAITGAVNIDNPGVNGFKGQVSWSTVGDSIMPQIGQRTIPIVSHLAVRDRNKTQTDLTQFSDGLHKDIEAYFSSLKNAGSTQIYHNLSFVLSRMAKSPANRKILILMTDGVEESRVINFAEKYKAHPSELMNDYETIKRTFLDVARLPDLRGIEIKIIGTDNGASDLPFQCRKFWERFLLEHSAKSVEILPNL